MGYAIPIKSIGNYVINQIAQARDAYPGALDGGPPLLLRRAEITVLFATADGLPITPAEVIIGEEPIPIDEAQRRLEPLTRKVFVTKNEVSSASTAARGKLILRIVLE